jgi:hypothetical protein
MYADWKSQVAYSSPNWNGFSFTVGLTQAWDPASVGVNVPGSNFKRGGSQTAYEGKASYEWAGDVAGKVWVSGLSQNVEQPVFLNDAIGSERAQAWDIGANVNVAGFGLTGYYGQGKGTGTGVLLNGGFDANGKRRDSTDWYVQGTYTIPGVGTKLGVSYGESELERNGSEKVAGTKDYQNSMWTVGAYHPLTKHLNLVAEYSQQKLEAADFDRAFDGKAKTVSLGAILFF